MVKNEVDIVASFNILDPQVYQTFIYDFSDFSKQYSKNELKKLAKNCMNILKKKYIFHD